MLDFCLSTSVSIGQLKMRNQNVPVAELAIPTLT